VLTTPTVVFFEPFDATKDYIVKFNYTGQTQIVKNQILIEDVSNSTVVYTKELSTFLFQQKIDKNTLSNGKTYRIKIRVGDIDNNWSDYSNFYIFYTLSEPSITIKNILNEQVLSQNILLEALYKQSENEELQSYQYLLYDSNKTLVNTYPTKYNSDILKQGNETILKQELTNLKNDTIYYVRVITKSVKGQSGDSGYIRFKAVYVASKLNSLLHLENVCKEGAVKITLSNKIIRFKAYTKDGKAIPDDNIRYVNGEYIDLVTDKGSYIELTENINMSSENLIIQLWTDKIQDNAIILGLYSNTGYSWLRYYDKRFHFFKQYNNSIVKAHFVSNEIADANRKLSIRIKITYGMVDIIVEEVQ